MGDVIRRLVKQELQAAGHETEGHYPRFAARFCQISRHFQAMIIDVESISRKNHNISYCQGILARKLTEPVEVREGDAPTVPMASPTGDPHGSVEIVLATGHRMTAEGPFDENAVGRSTPTGHLLPRRPRPMSSPSFAFVVRGQPPEGQRDAA
jgi:hypothetical protein